MARAVGGAVGDSVGAVGDCVGAVGDCVGASVGMHAPVKYGGCLLATMAPMYPASHLHPASAEMPMAPSAGALDAESHKENILNISINTLGLRNKSFSYGLTLYFACAKL